MGAAGVIDRLKDQVTAFSGRVEPAASFAEMVARNAFPQTTPAAHVLPLAYQGGKADVATGMYRQEYEHVVSVLITLRTNSQTGGRAATGIEELLMAVIRAVVGWGPEGAIGEFRLLRGGLVHTGPGLLVYQIDFVITDQLRILP